MVQAPCAGEPWFDMAATPDVLVRGAMPWPRAMGDAACAAACTLVRAAAAATTATAGASPLSRS